VYRTICSPPCCFVSQLNCTRFLSILSSLFWGVALQIITCPAPSSEGAEGYGPLSHLRCQLPQRGSQGELRAQPQKREGEAAALKGGTKERRASFLLQNTEIPRFNQRRGISSTNNTECIVLKDRKPAPFCTGQVFVRTKRGSYCLCTLCIRPAR